MQDTSEDSRMVGFFAMPREMRDEIYFHLTADIELISGTSPNARGTKRIKVTVKNAPLPKALRLNRQFRAEYDEQIAPMRTLVFSDMGGTLKKPSLDNLDLTLFTKCEIYLIATCGPGSRCAEKDVDTHNKWTSSIVSSMAKLERLKIGLSVDWDRESAPEGHEMHHSLTLRSPVLQQSDKLARTPKLRAFRCTFRSSTAEALVDLSNTRKILHVLWTEAGGWIDSRDPSFWSVIEGMDWRDL